MYLSRNLLTALGVFTVLVASIGVSTPALADLDVKLGELYDISALGRIGTYPNGVNGISMATTSCNVGDVDVPWHAPMEEDHPTIAMQLYREMDGKFEQVGVSWMKHGFYALSNSQCTPCQHPSNGSFLGVGCSDTYGVGNNGSRQWLGPRDEVNPFTGVWQCENSYFSGYQPDCVRREPSGALNSVEHRLEVSDADLGLPGATYYYEACYIVRNDTNRMNDWGSRRCTMTWNGSSWNFSTPGGSNSLLEGPAILRWATNYDRVSIGASDGDFIVAVRTTDLENGYWHYEYAVLNDNSDRQIRTFSVPVAAGVDVTNIEFHDWDSDAGDDWVASVAGGRVSWQTETYQQNPDAHALSFGLLFNFRFDANRPPSDSEAWMDMFKPGFGSLLTAATQAPSVAVAVEPGSTVAATAARLAEARPNPLKPSTTIGFELNESGSVSLEIFDATGRLVRTVVSGSLAAGSHSAEWDGADAVGRRVAPGVYYYRLKTGEFTASRSVVVVE